MSCADLFLAFIAILFPPIAVWIKVGICTIDSIINIALCCLGYLPGLLHAWYIIARNPEHDYDYEPLDNEHGGDRVTYYYVSRNQQSPGQRQGQMNYGGTSGGGRAQKKPNASSQPPAQESGVVGTGGPEGATGSSSQQQEPHVPGGENAPPSYSDAVKGDNKVQTDD